MLLSLCRSRSGFGVSCCLVSLSRRRPRDRSLPACDRGRRVPAPRREGRRVKAGAPTQEPVSSGIPYAVSLMKNVLFIVFMSFWYAALFLHKLLLQVYASFSLLILEMLVWDKSACIISCSWYLILSNYVQTNPGSQRVSLSLSSSDPYFCQACRSPCFWFSRFSISCTPGVQRWPQVAAIATAISKTNGFASST